MQFFNQNSSLIFGIVILCFIAFLLFRDGVKPADFLILGTLVIGLGIAWIILRPSSSHLNDRTEARAQIGQGIPVLLEFQSPF